MTSTHVEAEIEEVVRRFAARLGERVLAAGGPDGDLAQVPALIREAHAIGLLAEQSPADPELDLGVWGARTLTAGVRSSLVVLETLAEVDAGVAAAVHGHGLGRLALTLAGAADVLSGSAPALAAQPAYGLLGDPRADVARLCAGATLTGAAVGVLSLDRPSHLVCAARDDAGDRALVVVAATAPGVTLRPAEPRLGLRAAAMHAVTFDDVVVAPSAVVAAGDRARRALDLTQACDWLGQAAIIAGAARGAIGTARRYAADRYQAGGPIAGLPAVRLLLGNAERAGDVLMTQLRAYDGVLADADPPSLLRWAAGCRLSAGDAGYRAVSDALQVLGGYGYMDDYGQSKRLRDVATLRVLHGTAAQLADLVNGLAAAGTRRH